MILAARRASAGRRSRRGCLLTLVATGVVTCGSEDAVGPHDEASPPPTPTPEAGAPPESVEGTTDRALRELSRLYDRALEAGGSASDDVVTWTAEDLARIGAWEYRVESLSPEDDAAMAAALNEWGRERWEVFWVERDGEGYTFLLKRSARSLLRHVPVSDLLRLLPNAGTP